MRVSWDRYAGEDIEAVVAMMVNREHPDSVRITPSKGDGGVDILDRGAGPAGGDVVYQVKRYAKSLTAKQKREVEKSLARLLDADRRDPRWKSLNVTQWRLVTPWDPTPEAETWLQDLASTYGVHGVWDGLTVVDGWCAAYPEVVDYYLRDSRDEIVAASRQALAFTSLGGPGVQDLTLRELAERVTDSLHGPLTRDPHYRYEFRSGTGQPAPAPSVAGLVMSTYEVRKGSWFAIDVVALCAASVSERPITITGTASAPKGTAAAEALQMFFEYGTQPDAPFLFTGELDAPGGLGGTLTAASARVLAAPPELGERGELRLDVLSPDGAVLASADVNRTDRGAGSRGVSFTLREVNDVFMISGHAELTARQPGPLSMRVERLPLTGKPVAQAAGPLSFLAHLHDPNQLRTSVRHAPPEHGAIQPLTGVEPSDGFTAVADAVAALAVMQQHTALVLRVPDLAVHHGQVDAWALAARVLGGSPVTRHYPEGHAVIIDLEADVSSTELGSVYTVVPLKAKVGDDGVDLGEVRIELDDARVESRTPLPGGGVRCVLTTPERSMRWVRHDTEGA